MKKTLLAFILAAMVIFSACGGSKNSYADSNSSVGSAPENKVSYEDGKADSVNINKDTAIQSQQMVIISYRMELECEDIGKTADKIRERCGQAEGYVESEEISQYSGYIVIRVPSKESQGVVDFLNDKFDVTRSKKSTQDITDKYVDNDARITNLKAEEAQILEVLKKANTVESILSVQNKLYEIRGEIESLEALKKSWDSRVQYSTIEIDITQKTIISDSKRSIIGGSEFFRAIKKGFTNTTVGLILFIQRLIIFLVSNILLIIIIAGGAYGAVRLYRRKPRGKDPKEASNTKIKE